MSHLRPEAISLLSDRPLSALWPTEQVKPMEALWLLLLRCACRHRVITSVVVSTHSPESLGRHPRMNAISHRTIGLKIFSFPWKNRGRPASPGRFADRSIEK
jgi:hypothetical protein